MHYCREKMDDLYFLGDAMTKSGALIGRVARYTPSSELNIQTKIEHRII